ncbi:unknown [Clostridium sp. CAG:594]|mgnify:FL=1|nr:unknown [Clostridium sp. CAG:594]
MKKNINKMIITLVVVVISFFSKTEIFKALPTCNIGSEINESKGYGYAYTTVDANGRSGVSSGQINICKNMDCSGSTTLTGGWLNWSEGERNFFVEYDSGPETKITDVEYTLYREDKNGDAEALCKGTPAVDISNNNGVVHISFSIENDSVLKIEANGKYTDSAGKSKSFPKESFNIRHKLGNTDKVKNIEQTTQNTKKGQKGTTTTKPKANPGSYYGKNGIANESTTTAKGAASGTRKGQTKKELETNADGEIINSSSTSCTEVSDLIHDYWKYVMIIVPILLIVMITIDFFKALAKGDSDSIKKAGNNTVKRTIAAVVLLALPALLGLIFSWVGLDLCV